MAYFNNRNSQGLPNIGMPQQGNGQGQMFQQGQGYQPAGGPYGPNPMFSQQPAPTQQDFPQFDGGGGLRDIGRKRRWLEILRRQQMFNNGQNGFANYNPMSFGNY